MPPLAPLPSAPQKRPLDPFRRAVLRGLGVLLPPLLTIVIFLWVGSTVITYLLEPMEKTMRYVLVEYASDVRSPDEIDDEIDSENESLNDGRSLIDGQAYFLTADNKLVPQTVADQVRNQMGGKVDSQTAQEIYTHYFDEQYLQRQFVIPLFLGIFILALYLLGKFLAAGFGRLLWSQFERLITTLPLISAVYSSVKQVTDFMFSERQIEATRVVAVEYPRRGIWTLAMVTGESMLDIRAAANEPVLSVLIPTSPMPFTGFTVTVRKSETIDLDITMDQALQFIVSCGVVVPPHQIASALNAKQAKELPAVDSSANADSTHSDSSPPAETASSKSEETTSEEAAPQE